MSLEKEKILKAGKIASEAREFIRKKIKKGMKLIEIANMLEDKIFELHGKPAFPTCLSVDNIAAHATPSYDDSRIALGLLKVDFGVHIDGWIADTAFSIDLENSEENKKMILASENAVESAIKTIKTKISLGEIGKNIQKEIELLGFAPIINLCGHSVERWILHAGISIPNFDNRSSFQVQEGLYAIEPFSTNGNGKIHDGRPSGIYKLENEKNPRSQIAREILEFIIEEYNTLPFCSRWLVKKFGTKSLIALKQLEENGNIHSYAELVESSNGKVAQTEHTILVEKKEIIVTTR